MSNLRMRSTISGVLSAALLAAILPATALAQDEPEATPEGVNWSLAAIGGEQSIDVPFEAGATLFMEGGQADGSTGCNSFSASYTLEGELLSFDENISVTQALCEGPAGEIERAYLEALPTVVGWGIDEFNELSLLDGAQGVALVYGEPAQPIELTEADIETLIVELERLHHRINTTRQDVRQLKVDSLRERVAANQAVLDEVSLRVVNQNVPGLRDRVIANEAVLNALTKRLANVGVRVRSLEERVALLEGE